MISLISGDKKNDCQNVSNNNSVNITKHIDNSKEKPIPIPIVKKTNIYTDPLVIDLYINKKTKIDPDVIDRINMYIDKAEYEGFNFIKNMNSVKEFSNPYILSNAVDFFDINQYNSNIITSNKSNANNRNNSNTNCSFDPHDEDRNKIDHISNINKDMKTAIPTLTTTNVNTNTNNYNNSNISNHDTIPISKTTSLQNLNTSHIPITAPISNINIQNTKINNIQKSQSMLNISSSIHTITTNINNMYNTATANATTNATSNTGLKRKSRFN